MHKIIFYIPTILITVIFVILTSIFGISSTSPMVIIWIILFLISSILLGKNKFWGSLLGVLPGIHWIYMSTQDTGQPINIELPLGIITMLYCAVCGYYVYRSVNK